MRRTTLCKGLWAAATQCRHNTAPLQWQRAIPRLPVRLGWRTCWLWFRAMLLHDRFAWRSNVATSNMYCTLRNIRGTTDIMSEQNVAAVCHKNLSPSTNVCIRCCAGLQVQHHMAKGESCDPYQVTRARQWRSAHLSWVPIVGPPCPLRNQPHG